MDTLIGDSSQENVTTSYETGIDTRYGSLTSDLPSRNSPDSLTELKKWNIQQESTNQNSPLGRQTNSLSHVLDMKGKDGDDDDEDNRFSSRLSSSAPNLKERVPLSSSTLIKGKGLKKTTRQSVKDNSCPPLEEIWEEKDNNVNTTHSLRKYQIIKNHKHLLFSLLFGSLLILISTVIGLAIKLNSGSKGCNYDVNLPPCPSEWIWINGSCYFFSDKTDNWESSRKFCESYDASLALLHNQTILNYVQRYKDAHENYWVALRKDKEGKWNWLDGSEMPKEKVIHDNAKLDCAYLNSQFGALDCSTRRPWICIKHDS